MVKVRYGFVDFDTKKPIWIIVFMLLLFVGTIFSVYNLYLGLFEGRVMTTSGGYFFIKENLIGYGLGFIFWSTIFILSLSVLISMTNTFYFKQKPKTKKK